MGCCGWNPVHKTPTVPSVPSPSEPRHLVALHRAHAEVALMEATAGRPLCRVEGPDTEPVKRAEGRLAAIAELERSLRATGADPRQAAARLVERWEEERGRVAARGAAWEAYHAGGIAELETVAHELDAPSYGAAL
jgi:hypothetical protein